MTQTQIPRHHWLRLELTINLSSRLEEGSDEFGWESWLGSITAGWDTEDDTDFESALTDALLKMFPNRVLSENGEVSVHVGGCEFMRLNLDEPHPVFGKEVAVGSYGNSIFDAGDALSQDLADLLGPLTGGAGRQPFIDEVMDVAEFGWYDSLVLLRSIGIHKFFRGQKIGAWAAARGIAQLAPAPTTLFALNTSPLSRTEFLTNLGVADPDSHRNLTTAETAAWDDACARIGANWQKHLGLAALAEHPTVLYSPGGMNEALSATLRQP